MLSKWYRLKDKAIDLRKQGKSTRLIASKLGIPRSTLSGWLHNIQLTPRQQKILQNKWKLSLVKARAKAVLWHNKQKVIRLENARDEAQSVLAQINIHDKSVLELALAMLYLGEGSKTNTTAMGNTNPLVLKFFIQSLNILYGIRKIDFKAELHLRQDQNSKLLEKYWSNQLGIPIENFTYVIDRRPIKSKTYKEYRGVCVVRCGRIALQRRLIFLSELFCNKIQSYGPLAQLARAQY